MRNNLTKDMQALGFSAGCLAVVLGAVIGYGALVLLFALLISLIIKLGLITALFTLTLTTSQLFIVSAICAGILILLRTLFNK